MRNILTITFLLAFNAQFAKADHASPSFETGATGAILTTPGAALPKCILVAGVGVQ